MLLSHGLGTGGESWGAWTQSRQAHLRSGRRDVVLRRSDGDFEVSTCQLSVMLPFAKSH